MNREWFTAAELAGLHGVPGTQQNVKSKAKREHWNSRKRQAKGGGLEYHISSLPAETQAKLLAKQKPAQAAEKQEPSLFTYDHEQLWKDAALQTQKRRDIGEYRAELLNQCLHLVQTMQCTFQRASKIVADIENITPASLRNWYYGINGNIGARMYNRIDWPAALIPGYTQKADTADCDREAWDWFKGHYLTRRQPSIASSYRRLQEIAAVKKWTIPSERTLDRRVKKDISIYTRVLLREGPEALNKLYPTQKRDKRCFAAGEAVSGDGIKFDKLWIDWGDEIINTTTAWFWQDIHSNKFLSYRIAKTENTDVFRLATYDLTAICAPTYIQVDNTRVAANKAMTGGTPNRYRFHNRPEDPEGILNKLGMKVHFTNPDHTMSNPGVKPVERSFGIGGIHSEVASHPKIINRGYSKATAIPIAEFMEIVAQEVQRFNARPKRRTDICGGIKSFDEAFNDSFAVSEVRLLTASQRRLLLLMPESAKVTAAGEINLKAGAKGNAKNRYWHQSLAELKGADIVAYYDPENLSAGVAVYNIEGRFICDAEHKAGIAFNDTAASREHAKFKKRILKSQKQIAQNETRMTDLERQALYPETIDPVDIPAPGVVRGNFGQKQQVDESLKIQRDAAVGDDATMWNVNFAKSVARMKQKREEELF